MSTKVSFSIFLIIAGVVTGMLTIFAYGMSGGNTAITMAFLFAAIVCIMSGSILAFTRLLDRMAKPLIEEIHKDIEDDLQDLKERRFTNTHWMVIIVTLALVMFSFFIFRFHKVEATWGPIPVIVPTTLAMLALAWFIPRTSWFCHSRDYTPMWIFLIPTIGLVISLWLGLSKTENLATLRAAPTDPVSYNTYRPAGIFLQTAGDVVGGGFNVSLPDCDNDACGAILLVIGLIILTFVLVIGSAFIPHFWILSTSLLLGIMLLIAIHDLRIRPESKSEVAAST
jgi:hypothetical protein